MHVFFLVGYIAVFMRVRECTEEMIKLYSWFLLEIRQ